MKIRLLLLALVCFTLGSLPVRAQGNCPLPAQLQTGAGWRIRFTDGTPLRMLDDVGDGQVITTLYEGQNVTILDDPPRCLQGVRWWKVRWSEYFDQLDGWIPDSIKGISVLEPLSVESAQENMNFQVSLLNTHLWGVVAQDASGFSIAYRTVDRFQPLTQASHGVIVPNWNELFVWDETGLYHISPLGKLTPVLAGDQTHIVDVTDFNNSLAVLYAEDCQNCYSIVTLEPSEDMTVVSPLWHGKTEHPLTGLETWMLDEDDNVAEIFARQQTERANSPYPSSGAILAFSAEQGMRPLETRPNSDEAISAHGRWLASAGDDDLRLTNLETNERYDIPYQYGDIGAMPIFSGEGFYLCWLEIALQDGAPRSVTMRGMEMDTRSVYTIHTFDVSDGRLPMPGVLNEYVILNVRYRDNELGFDISQENIFTTWLPAPARRIVGTLIVGD